MTVSSLSSNLASAGGYSVSKLTASAQAAIDAATKEREKASAGTATSGISISAAARIAAAEKADNKKDFTALSAEVRKSLDAQYAAADGIIKPDVSEMSGRALAAIALNKTGTFSRLEMATATHELNERARLDLTEALKSGDALTALANYNQQLIADYDGMSQEERDARGWTAKIRSSAESFVTAVQGNGNTPSLFALLNGED